MSLICEGKCKEDEYCNECAPDKLRAAKAKLKIAVEALESAANIMSDKGSHDPDECYDILDKAIEKLKQQAGDEG